jgi:methylglutaconyl-CoA hydratase
MSTVILQREGPIARVRLNRPEVRNALNDDLIKELTAAFKNLEKQKEVRVVILSGEGDCFCAGADLAWLQATGKASKQVHEAGARRFAGLLSSLNRFPRPIIAQVHGAAVGGGVGLISVCDIVFAAQNSLFALAEVKLGLIPAVISPFVVAKIGAAAARRYFLTGERFTADVALRIGLVHESVPLDHLPQAANEAAGHLLSSGPEAIRHCKELIRKVGRGEVTSPLQQYTVKKIASLRSSPEAQEGMKAFLEKRKPNWNV